MHEPTRRDALVTIAGAAMAIPLSAQAGFFNATELATVGALTDAIIPRTDTPGAIDAGVPAFIGRRLSGNAKLAAEFRDGLKLMDAEAVRMFKAPFAKLTAAQQVEVLTPASKDAKSPAGRFFTWVKNWTIDGYYSSKEGLAQELGWHGNSYLPEFKGCTHPEHQS